MNYYCFITELEPNLYILHN